VPSHTADPVRVAIVLSPLVVRRDAGNRACNSGRQDRLPHST